MFQRPDHVVEITPKRADFVKDNLHLSDQELHKETGLTENVIALMREVQDDEDLQPWQTHPYQNSTVYDDPNKIPVKKLMREFDISRSSICRDIEKLDFIEKKMTDEKIWITPEEFERYKQYRKEVTDE